MAQPFVLDQTPLDDPNFALDGDGSLAIPGRDILVELDVYDITNATETTFYFGSRGYNHPTAPDYYAPRLSQPLNFRRDIYDKQTTGGAGRVSYGEMRIINNDGALDFLDSGSFALAGRLVRMLIGDIDEAYDTFEPLIVGRVQQMLFTNTEVVIQLRDRLQDLAGPLQEFKYAGTNVLPDGLEGADSEDIKDRPKPLGFGYFNNITPPCVNTSRLIYQANDGPVTGIFVFDNGALLTQEAFYADQADMEANAPTAGCYRVWVEGGYFRLGATPTGTITCTAADMALDVDNTAAQIAVRIATRTQTSGEGGFDSADINFDDVDALDLANPATVGIWLAGGETYAQALDAVLTSIGAWYTPDRTGMLRMQRLEEPALPYVTTCRAASLSSPLALGEFNIVDYRLVPSNDPEKGLPTWRVSLNYDHNYTVQPPSVTAGVVLQSRKSFLALADRTEVSESQPVKDASPLAVEKTVSTLLKLQTAASDEASRLLSMFDSQHDFLELDLILTSDLIALVDLGAVINVVLPRGLYAAGKLMRVTGMAYNAAQGIVTLACWG